MVIPLCHFPNINSQYKIINCKSTDKNSICNKWYHTYHNSLENVNKFIDKFSKTFYSVLLENSNKDFKYKHY